MVIVMCLFLICIGITSRDMQTGDVPMDWLLSHEERLASLVACVPEHGREYGGAGKYRGTGIFTDPDATGRQSGNSRSGERIILSWEAFT